MQKRRIYKPILIVVSVLFLILVLFSTYYFGFRQETIYGVPSEVKVGDVIKFHAIAQVGGRAGITCYAEPDWVRGNPDCSSCLIVSLGKKELKDGCVGLPCNLYDQWSDKQLEAGNEIGLDIKYTCSGVTAPPNDKLTFSVKEATTSSITCYYCGGGLLQFTSGSYTQCPSGTSLTKPTCSPICTPDWRKALSGTCTNGVQKLVVYDINNCNDNTNKPADTQTCTSGCFDSDNEQEGKIRGSAKLATDSSGKEDYCSSETELIEY